MRIFERLKEEVQVRQSARQILAAKEFEYDRQAKTEEAGELKAKGYSNYAIARQLGVTESTVRRLLRESSD